MPAAAAPASMSDLPEACPQGPCGSPCEFRAQSSGSQGLRVSGSQGSEFGVSGCRFQGLGFRVAGFRVRGFRV